MVVIMGTHITSRMWVLYLSSPYQEDNLYHLHTLKYWFLSSLEVKSAFLVMPLVTVVLLQCRLFEGSLGFYYHENRSEGFLLFFFFLDLKKNNQLLFFSPNPLTSSIWIRSLCLLSCNWEQGPSSFRSRRFPGDPDSSSSHPVLKNVTVTPTTLGYLPPLVFSPNIAALILKSKPLSSPAAKVLREVAMLVISGIPWWLSSPQPFSAQKTPPSLQIHPSFYKWHIHLPFLQAKITGVV